ncbi:MAG: hypothetical protein IIC46_08485, partial [Planctomycetes bacterium]|nr:hypothetical protein [Planctomycetota bacterium]
PTAPAAADILHVPGDFPTIQAAIDAAVDGDEVEVHPGTYNETINFLGKAIRVYSTDGSDVTIIDGQQNGTVVTCANGEGPETVIDGFTITGGSGTNGGGMRNYQSSPTVINCTITGNLLPAEYNVAKGSGMSNVSSNPTVINCVFSQNDVVGGCWSYGGGMYNLDSNPTVTHCTFDGNGAFDGGCAGTGRAYGGGMFNNNSSPIVSGCNFSGNIAKGGKDGGGGWGAGMYNENGSAPTITDCVFASNRSPWGAGMENRASSPTLNNCTFTSNLAIGDKYSSGAGMRNRFNSAPTIINCTFRQNSATMIGGGLSNSTGGKPAVSDSIFCGNTPDNIAGDYTDNGGICLADTCDDTNGNGIPDECECPGDLDNSGDVGVKDLLVLLGAWGPCPKKGNCPADFDDSGDVGVKDLLILLGAWGPCP